MKFIPLLLLLLPAVMVSAQPLVYQSFDVDSVAQPRGGMPYLNSFLQTNLRKPMEARATGAGGRVFVKAIVEPDGRVTDVTVQQAFRPDCAREAVRVFSRFNAWQPAYKDGKPVRQFVNIPITFDTNIPFPYVGGTQVTYYDAKQQPITDSANGVQFRQLRPLNANGLPNGDLVIQKLTRQGWKEQFRYPFVSRKSEQRSTSGKAVRSFGVKVFAINWQGPVFDMDADSVLIHEAFYDNGRKTGYELTYHPNGIVAEYIDLPKTALDRASVTAWYANGQMKQTGKVNKSVATEISKPDEVAALWDSTGRLLVDGGNGMAVQRETVKSQRDTTRQTGFIETGPYLAGLKQGIWIGRYEDGSYFYEEQYDKGICQSGKAITAGSDTVRYVAPDQQPVFAADPKAMYEYLGQNIRYPREAVQNKIQGKVFVSFTVCTDGSLCDYVVLKGVHPALDNEAMRVVQKMSGRWKPGLRRGQPVRVKYNLPISFSLN